MHGVQRLPFLGLHFIRDFLHSLLSALSWWRSWHRSVSKTQRDTRPPRLLTFLSQADGWPCMLHSIVSGGPELSNCPNLCGKPDSDLLCLHRSRSELCSACSSSISIHIFLPRGSTTCLCRAQQVCVTDRRGGGFSYSGVWYQDMKLKNRLHFQIFWLHVRRCSWFGSSRHPKVIF